MVNPMSPRLKENKSVQKHNAEHYSRLHRALDILRGSKQFADIVVPRENTLVPANGRGALNQNQVYATVMAKGRFVAVGNVFWINMLYTPLPHVPIRTAMVEEVQNFTFKEPAHIKDVAVSILPDDPTSAARSAAFEPFTPEEVRHAFIFAIARDINAGRTEEVDSWRTKALTTTIIFVRHRNADERYWAALRSREHMFPPADPETINRTALQRIFELGRFRDVQRERNGPGAATAAAVLDAYTKNVTLKRKLSTSLVAMALTVYSRLLAAPEATSVLVRADSGPRWRNPFDSIVRLKLLVQLLETTEDLVWCLHHTLHLCQHLDEYPKYMISPERLCPNNTSDEGSILKLFLLKKRILTDMLLGDIPRKCHLDLLWLKIVAWSRLSTHAEWKANFGPGRNRQWQGGTPKHVLDYLNLVSDIVYGKHYDNFLCTVIKADNLHRKIETQPGLAYQLAVIAKSAADLAEKEKGTTTEEQGQHQDAENMLEFNIWVNDATDDPEDDPTLVTKTVNLLELPKADVDKIDWAKCQMESLLRANVELLVKSSTDLRADLLKTLAGSLKGCPERSDATYWNYHHVLVILDSKVMGGSWGTYELPPVDENEVRRLVEIARARHDVPGRAREEALPGDMFLLLDGGRSVEQELMAPFQGRRTDVHLHHLTYEPVSLQARHAPIRPGFPSHTRLECMRTVTHGARKPKRADRLAHRHCQYRFSPVVLPSWDRTWKMSYKDKQKLFGHNYVGVGGQGKLVEEAPDPQFEEPTPVFFHALPESCWTEILEAFRPNSVIDLTASDEALPLACVKNSIPYVGFCMTEFHKEALWRRLTRSALRDAADEDDALYDEDLANTILSIGDDAAGDTDETGTRKQKHNPKANNHTAAKDAGIEKGQARREN